MYQRDNERQPTEEVPDKHIPEHNAKEQENEDGRTKCALDSHKSRHVRSRKTSLQIAHIRKLLGRLRGRNSRTGKETTGRTYHSSDDRRHEPRSNAAGKTQSKTT